MLIIIEELKELILLKEKGTEKTQGAIKKAKDKTQKNQFFAS